VFKRRRKGYVPHPWDAYEAQRTAKIPEPDDWIEPWNGGNRVTWSEAITGILALIGLLALIALLSSLLHYWSNVAAS
jgi:hypothetical protein